MDANIDLTPEEEVRFQNLRKWRKSKADELDLPAFCIFSDKTLKEIAFKNPKSIEQLKMVYGIGENKIERFGWDVLAEIRNS